jgi:hypothetical protein
MIKFNLKRSSDLPVIQIGVGGYSSSGKTVLIDAMFSFFSTVHIPPSIPENFGGLLLETTQFDGSYTHYTALRSSVSNRFHLSTNATVDTGEWDEHTYTGRLNFCGMEKILLVRNLPGEMFRLFFEQSGNQNKSVKTLFDEFVNSHKKDREIKDRLFKFTLTDPKKNNTDYISRQMGQLRDAFIEAKLKERGNEEVQNIRKNFYAFLFYISSDYNVYCIKSTGRSQGELRNDNENIYLGAGSLEDVSRFMICFTQIDRIMETDTLPPAELLPAPAGQSTFRKIWADRKNILLEQFGLKKTNPVANENNGTTRYWTALAQLYNDVIKKQYRYIKEDGISQLHNFIGQSRHKWFMTSVAYSYPRKKFLKFAEQGTTINAVEQPGRDTSGDSENWRLDNSNERTPIGVLELMLHILKKEKYDLGSSGLYISTLKSDPMYNGIFARILH